MELSLHGSQYERLEETYRLTEHNYRAILKFLNDPSMLFIISNRSKPASIQVLQGEWKRETDVV